MSTAAPPYKCQFCGAPSWHDPSDQTPPPDYCHESDHGDPADYAEDDPCPDCGKQLKVRPGGGVGCTCGYWFCY